jgi:DNA-binding XRE family transcriptional regulator
MTKPERLKRQQNCKLGAILLDRHRTVNTVADAIEVGRSTVRQWVKGQNAPNALALQDLCEYLNCTINDLYPKGE